MRNAAPASASSASAPVCRICWESTCEANGSDTFLTPTPCACRDERSNVHQDCLERWILEARSQGRFDCGTVCHACGANYAHPALAETVLSASAKAAVPPGDLREHDTREPIAIVGGTGYVGRSVCLHLVNHPTFRLGAVVGSAATVGKPFSAVFEKKEEALVEHYGADLWKPQQFPQEFMSVRVSSVEEVLKRGECRVALSFIAPEHGEIEDALGAAGVKVFSISPHARFDPANPLSVPEANPETLRDAVAASFADKRSDARSLVKSPNCVTCGVAVALKALDDVKKWGGVRDVAITTFQSLSGRGDAKYPRELVMGNVYPLKGTVERTGEYQKGELKRLMPGVERVSVGAYRVPVQKGHLVDVRVRFKRNPDWDAPPLARAENGAEEDEEKQRTDEKMRETRPLARKPTALEIKEAFERFDPLRDAPLPSKPRRAIVVKPLDVPSATSAGPAFSSAAAAAPPRLGTPRPKDDCEFENGMAICVGNIDVEDDCFDVAFCVVVNNVARGAWGAAMLNAEYWAYLRNRKPGESAFGNDE